jgi:hypothetical protein
VKLYADRASTALRQLVTDVIVVIWVYVWIRLAMALYDLVEKLAVPGQKLQGAGTGMADNLDNVGSHIGDVPIAGKSLAAPFGKAADAARSLSDAGKQQQDIVHHLSWILAALTLAVPLALVLFVWLPLRVRWMVRAGAAKKLRSASAGRDLLALRALATQPLGRLTRMDPEIAAAWRRGDPKAVDALAIMQLKSLGLRG